MAALKPLLSLCLLLLPAAALAQDDAGDAGNGAEFRLFEEVEQTTPQQPVRPRNLENGGGSTEPEFTLIGTSHIGDRYAAVLRHRSGNPVRMTVNPDGNTRIPGYQGYNVVHIGPGKVSIRHPDDNPCIEAPLKGVSCNGDVNIAALELANGEPIARRIPAQAQPEEQQVQQQAEGEEPRQEPTNPFAQLRAAREANAGNNNNDGAAFRRRTIEPEDIPPGMRVVSTPFGDRLVQQ